MKYGILLFALAGILFLFTGCAGKRAETQAASSTTMPEHLAGDVMLSALRDENYALFIGNFSAELKKSVPEAAFRKLCVSLAEKRETWKSWRCLDILDRGGIYRTEVWKVTVRRKGKSAPVLIDRLFYVTTANPDGANRVIGFKFDALF